MTRPTSTSALDPGWVLAGGAPVFYRGRVREDDAPVVVHVHGFAISGRYMLPTAVLLADEFTTYVPDLPGFGRSPRPDRPLDIPGLADTVAAFLDALGVGSATLVGNSLGCAILAEFSHRHPDRLDRAVMVSPAGGRHSQPLARAVWQLLRDAPREPVSMARVAVPDYVHFGPVDSLRLFAAMTRFPAFERLTAVPGPLLAVLGARDPLLPPAARIREAASQMDLDHLTLALIRDAAHAINYSHPRELSGLVRAFLRDEPMVSQLAPSAGSSPVAVLRHHR